MKITVKTLMSAFAAALVVMTASCGSKKMAPAEFKGEKLQQETICQQLKEEKPATRAFGEATNFNLSFAKTYAEGQARTEFARQLSSMITSGSNQSSDAADKFASNGKKSRQVSDQGLQSDAFAQQIAEQTVPSLVVIKTETYRLKDNQYHVFVCLEYTGSVNDLAEDITEAYMARVKNMIPDEDREEMEVRHNAFHDYIIDEINRLNGVTE